MPQTVIDLSRPNGGAFSAPGGSGFDIAGTANGAFLGLSVATGDFNGDGFADIVIGEPNADPVSIDNGGPGVVDAGIVHVLLSDVFGPSAERNDFAVNSPPSNYGFVDFYGEGSNDQLGFSVANVGDFNGDGIDDLLIGAPNGGSDGKGAAYLFFGDPGLEQRFPVELATALGQQSVLEISGATIGGRLGTTVSAVGDINRDGFADLAIGAPFGGNPVASQGEVYVIFGRAGTSTGTINVGTMSLADGFTITGAASGDQLGASIAGIRGNFTGGQINNDEFPDFVIGAPGNDEAGSNAGAAYVIYGKATGQFANIDLSNLADADGWTVRGAFGGDMAGSSVALVRDNRLLGDAAVLDSIAIGAPGADQTGTDSGYVAFVPGFNAASRAPVSVNGSATLLLGGGAGDMFGAQLAGYHGILPVGSGSSPNSLSEGLLVSAPGANAVYAFYPNALDDDHLGATSVDALGSEDGAKFIGLPDTGFGRSLSGGFFDIDGDNQQDFVVGAPFFNFSGPSQPGTAHVILGQDNFERGTEFTLLNTDGSGALIVGNGTVFGTQGYQNITILDGVGNVVLDPSFNTGDDDVRFPGDAADWFVGLIGSSVEFRDGDTSVFIPISPNTIYLRFDDGVRTLSLDTSAGKIMFSDQEIPSSFVRATGAAQALNPLTPDPNQISRLLLNPNADIFTGGKLDVFGTNGNELVRLTPGSHIVADQSFNRGGDIIDLPGASSTYLASFVGSSVLIDNGTTSANVPFGPNGTTLSFDNQDLSLFFDTNVMAPFIGTTQISNIPINFI